MDVQIKRFAPCLVAAVRYTGPYDESCAACRKNCAVRWRQTACFPEASVAYGVSYDNPDITSPQKCRMDACVCLPPHLTEASAAVCALQQHEEILRYIGGARNSAWRCLLKDLMRCCGLPLAVWHVVSAERT